MSASDSFRLMIWELVAAVGVVMVIVGILGEGSELLVKWVGKKKYKKFQAGMDDGLRWFLAILVKFVRPRILEVETFAFALVVLGLVAEFWGSQESQQILGKNNLQLNLAAEQLGRTNAQLVASNLELEKQVNETKTQLANAQANLIDLQNANLPMDIGNQPEFALKLVEFPETPIKDLPKTPVKLRALANDKAHKTADDLEIAFDFFHNWILIDRADIGEIGESGIIISYRYNDDLSEKAAKLIMKALTAKNVPSKIFTGNDNVRFEGIPTNGVMVVVCNRPDPLNEKLMLVQAKQAELQYQPTGLGMEIWKMQQKKFVVDSEEYRKALVEYNNLISQYTNTQNEISALNESEKKLISEINKAAFGTNSSFRLGLMRFDPTTRSFGEKIVK